MRKGGRERGGGTHQTTTSGGREGGKDKVSCQVGRLGRFGERLTSIVSRSQEANSVIHSESLSRSCGRSKSCVRFRPAHERMKQGPHALVVTEARAKLVLSP